MILEDLSHSKFEQASVKTVGQLTRHRTLSSGTHNMTDSNDFPSALLLDAVHCMYGTQAVIYLLSVVAPSSHGATQAAKNRLILSVS